jgi:cell shape-determining protein MreD
MKKSYTHLFLRFFKTFTLLAVIVALGFAYFYLPERVITHFNQFDNPDSFIGKEQFFYMAGITAVVFNITLALLANMVSSIHPRYLHVPNSTFWMENKDSRKHFYEIYEQWLSSLAILINIFLVVCIAVLIRGRFRETQSVFDYSWLPMLGGILLLGWIIYLPFRLRFKKLELFG